MFNDNINDDKRVYKKKPPEAVALLVKKNKINSSTV